MKKIIICIMVFILPFIGFSQTDNNLETNTWEFQVTPYLWMTGLSGNISILNQEATLDVEFKDVLSHLKMAVPLHVEAKNGNWAIMADAYYSKLSKSAEIQDRPTDILVGDEIKGTIKQTVLELGLGYTFAKVNNFTMDALIGGRYFLLDVQLDNTTRGTEIVDKKVDFLDPYFGLRFANNGEKWAVGGRIDIGGFGSGSEISYKYNLLVGYNFSQLFRLDVGYQSLKPDYVEKNYTYNVGSEGPILGLNFSF